MKPDIKSLYYITHIENLPSIFERGILSHSKVEEMNVAYTPIYDGNIVSRRKSKLTPNGKSLWEYANLYFQVRNPMLYRVIHEAINLEDIAIIGVSPQVLTEPGAILTDGNAANDPTQFYDVAKGRQVLLAQWKIINSEWWNDLDGSKRKIMSECLVPNLVKKEFVHSIFVANHTARERVQKLLGAKQISAVPEPNLFFQPRFSSRIGNVSLIDGDMFFSNMQTLTISVNLQGVMGKGLASRAKYQFPDVYVVYQDACRDKRITATKPYPYKRESSLDEELADLSTPLSTPNAVKWFLLFATKRKWRENSRLDDIEGGLDWVRKNWRREGITSLAMPALGCGLGNLSWAEVGPLMCRYLHGLEIPVAIYLPREVKLDAQSQHLSEKYLLGQ
ncbi:MAG: DarT ssDNA thymidine ADP-ribosyltransferase family protein [Blastocatellia bacterium]